MIIFLIILFGFLAMFVMIISNPKYHMTVFLVLCGLLILTAGFRAQGITGDYENYLRAYEDYANSRMEPTFRLIAGLVKNLFNSSVYLFLIYAMLGVGLKFLALKQITRFYLFSALLYLSNFFLLHEMTQIRAGVASALLLLCIKPLYDRDWVRFLGISVLAICFHFSSIIILLLWFLNVRKINRKLYLFLIPFAYILALSGITLGGFIQYIPVEPIIELYFARRSEMESGSLSDQINIFNSVQLLRCLIAMTLVFFSEKIFLRNKYSILLIKIYVLSTIMVPLFMDFPVVSFRASELLAIVEIVLIPLLVYLFSLKKPALVLPISIASFMLWLNLFYIKLIIQ